MTASTKAEVAQPKRPRAWRARLGFLLVLVGLASFLASAFIIGWDDAFAGLQARHSAWRAWAGEHTGLASIAYLGTYFAISALAVPGAAVLSLAGGDLFGFWRGLVLTSIGSTAGSTVAMLASRYLLRDYVRQRHASRLARFLCQTDGKETAWLLALRLNPIVPFWLINLFFGFTRISAVRFWIASQIGMLPGTAVYVNAGARLVEIEKLGDVFSWQLMLSLIALSTFPLLARALVQRLGPGERSDR